LIAACMPFWRTLGTNTALPILADATPVLLAIVGVVMSYIQPKRENHRATTFILIVAGLIGSAILSANRITSEATHKNEMTTLGNKVDTVRNQNTILSNFLISSKTVSEADRRQAIETTLRNEYVLSHDPIDPEILAGNAMPPAEWMNQRLRVLGESWNVLSSKITVPISTTTRTFLELEGNPHFLGGPASPSNQGHNFVPGEPLAFNIFVKSSGPRELEVGRIERGVFVEPDYFPKSELNAIALFKERVKKENYPETFASFLPTDEQLFTAFAGEGSTGQSRLVSADEPDSFRNGTEIVFVIVVITYKDAGVLHHLRQCMFLQPPAQVPGLWHFCGAFPNSD
jgi:hypothetical protein